MPVAGGSMPDCMRAEVSTAAEEPTGLVRRSCEPAFAVSPRSGMATLWEGGRPPSDRAASRVARTRSLASRGLLNWAPALTLHESLRGVVRRIDTMAPWESDGTHRAASRSLFAKWTRCGAGTPIRHLRFTAAPVWTASGPCQRFDWGLADASRVCCRASCRQSQRKPRASTTLAHW